MFLRILTFLIGYRFRTFATLEKFNLPDNAPNSLRGEQGTTEIKEKARASSAAAGVFLAVIAAFLAALTSMEHPDSLLSPLHSRDWKLLFALAGVLWPFLIFREERRISAADVEARGREDQFRLKRRFFLAAWVVLLIITFVPVFCDPSAGFGPPLSLSGFALIVISVILLVLSVEFYDSAGSWQAGDDNVYHFHMASIASHCYLMGLSLGLVGISLLFCRSFPRTGCILASVMLAGLIAMTETEREMYNLHKVARR